ncbi:MAG: M42 family metallopeptidase [Thermotoga caldifontis]|uniref:M42 family metallopeptidase n=1 Tax=Thermotoga caldifontis TaxID=1508419 RepID=UPI003C7C94BD
MYLKELSLINGASGDEGRVRDFIKRTIQDKVDEVWEDRLGNLIAFRKGTKGNRKILFAAHMDEVGFMVTNIDEDGTLLFAPVGAVETQVVVGKQVKIKDSIMGVIGFKPIHLQEKDQLLKPIRYEELRIYIGARNKEEAQKMVSIGDYVNFVTEYRQNGRRASGKAFDDRVGCSVLMDVIDKRQRYENDVYFAFVVQEEVGLRGSAVVVEQVKPDVAIVIEGTIAGDDPGLEKDRWSTHLGEGPAVTFMHSGYVVNQKVFQAILSVAEKHGIPHQFRRRTPGSTDAGRLARTGPGTASGVISVPTRYIHSPVCMIDLEDYANTVLLIEKILEEGEVFAK